MSDQESKNVVKYHSCVWKDSMNENLKYGSENYFNEKEALWIMGDYMLLLIYLRLLFNSTNHCCKDESIFTARN